MSSIDEILWLYFNDKLTPKSRFDFRFVKDGRKFDIYILFASDDEIMISSSYKGKIYSYIFCRIDELRKHIENIDIEFKNEFKRKTWFWGNG